MGAIGVVLLVAFVVICVLLVLLVLIQDQDNSGMGGVFGGGNSAAFGAHSASVLTKATTVFVVLFFVATFAIALLNKKDAGSDAAKVQEVVTEEGLKADSAAADSKWWKKNADSAAAPTEAAVETANSVATETTEATDATVETVENPETSTESSVVAE